MKQHTVCWYPNEIKEIYCLILWMGDTNVSPGVVDKWGKLDNKIPLAACANAFKCNLNAVGL